MLEGDCTEEAKNRSKPNTENAEETILSQKSIIASYV